MAASVEQHWRQRFAAIGRVQPMEIRGRITGLTGLTVEVVDFAAPIASQCEIITRHHQRIPAELIGFKNSSAILMPLGEMTGIASGDVVRCLTVQPTIPMGEALLGRVINGHGQAIDGKGPLLCHVRVPITAKRIQPLQRTRIDTPIGTGIRSIDALMTCGRGQRMGIFSGPGVGKSVLLGMISRYTSADISVIALIGERGREVREFVEKDLGPQGLARSVVVVSTSDEPAPLRVQAGFVATAIAEYFRDQQQKDVLLLMDSVTRIALAQRQIGLALGEPPATKGFTPSVFSLMPGLVERCGRTANGSVTGFYTILVEGDDLAEPVSDHMRSLLDGHLVLSRSLANRGHFPAIDILDSISRVMPDITKEPHRVLAREILRLTAIYRDIEDLVNIGAYAAGTNPDYDLAVHAHTLIDNFLKQSMHESVSLDQAIKALGELVQSVHQKASYRHEPPPMPTPENARRKQSTAGLDRMMAGVK